MFVLNTQGVVLKSTRYGDHDLILTIFTRQYGRVSAIAKGAQRQKSKLLYTSQLFSYNNYVLKKNKDMFTISQAESIKSFYDISNDLDSFSYASFLAKLVDSNIEEGQSYVALFTDFVKTLFLLSDKVENKKFIVDIFLIKFLDVMGYRPEVYKCVSCGEIKDNYTKISNDISGVICDNCGKIFGNYKKIDKITVTLMQYLLKNDIIVCSKARVSDILVDELFYLLKTSLIARLEYVNFKPLELIMKIN